MVSVSEDGVGESGLGRFLSRSCLISFAVLASLKDTVSSRAPVKGCCSDGLCFLGTDCASIAAPALGRAHTELSALSPAVPSAAPCLLFAEQIKCKFWLSPRLLLQQCELHAVRGEWEFGLGSVIMRVCSYGSHKLGGHWPCSVPLSAPLQHPLLLITTNKRTGFKQSQNPETHPPAVPLGSRRTL